MKTKLFSFQALVAVMLSVVMSMSFASCSDDDDEPADLASVILGTWEWSETNDNGVFATRLKNSAFISVRTTKA